MDRAYASGAAGAPPSASASLSTGYPTSGNSGVGTPATKPGAYWYHMVMEELMSVIGAAGITPDKSNLNQLAAAIQSGRLFVASAVAGTADAITGSYTPVITALTNGMTLYIRSGSANATATPTFTPASGTIAAKTIVKGAGAALAVGDIAGGGHWIVLQYDATMDKWVLLNPATGVSQQGYLCAADEKAASAGAGTSVSGVQTRTLNTLRGNTIQGASLSGNQITLPAGNYRIRASAPSTTGDGHRAFIYSVTDASILLLGTSENSTAQGSADGVTTSSSIVGRISISSQKVIELRHYTLTASANYGLGYPVNNSGNEVYSWIEITKE